MIEGLFVNGGYWALLGTFYLGFLTWQDVRNNMVVDDRKNSFMLGLTVSLYSHFYYGLFYSLCLMVIVIVTCLFFAKKGLVGGADISTIRWVLLGFGLLSPYLAFWWLVIFAVVTTLWLGLRRVMKVPREKKMPYYPVLLASFVINCVLFNLYF